MPTRHRPAKTESPLCPGHRSGRHTAGRLGRLLVRLLTLSHKLHRLALHAERTADAGRRRKHHVGREDVFRLHVLGLVLALRAERNAERTEIAQTHAPALLQAVDEFHFEGVEHRLHVGRSQGAALLDALNDFGLVHGLWAHEGRIELLGLVDGVLARHNFVLHHNGKSV